MASAEVELPLEAEEFLSWLAVEKGRSPNTITSYRRDLLAYVAWLADKGVGLPTATTRDVNAYVAALRGTGKAPASVARAVVAVRSVHAFMADEGSAEEDAAAELSGPRVPAGLPKALSEAEVAHLLGIVAGEEPLNHRDRAVLEVLYGTGMRISELVGLDLADLALDDALARVVGKGDKERVVPLGRYAIAALHAWLAPGGRGAVIAARARGGRDPGAVFLNARGGRLTRQGAWLILEGHATRAGLAERFSPHVLRHSCATHMLDHGADIRVVQELLGHASITTTQVYTKVSTERLRAVYDLAHPRARGSRRGRVGSHEEKTR